GDRLQDKQSDYRSDREMSLAQLDLTVDAARREVKEVRQEAREVSMNALDEALAGPGDTGARRVRPPEPRDR
ncbi:MAG: hypothetical protein GWN71_27760, partial [Gammaproteobacteria bacterium]|nr:hypothetical protein [Gemmatimonadota bacterium]NIU77209.1 hypothetical protein [Gammaproteobacteria bacterium]